MFRTPSIAGAVVAITLLAGCANSGYGPKQVVGALAGAGAGAFAGSKVVNGKQRIAAAAIGTLVGAFLGSEVGKSLDRADQLHAEQAQLQALESTPSGAQVAWRNPDSGSAGTVTPIRTYQVSSGEYCREFQHNARIGGQNQKVYGTACRSPDGQWHTVE